MSRLEAIMINRVSQVERTKVTMSKYTFLILERDCSLLYASVRSSTQNTANKVKIMK